MEKINMIDIILNNGYVESGNGYKRVSEAYTHWITLFANGALQMYSYFREDPEGDKEYDTGIIYVSIDELQTLINIFKNNYEY